ncbi:hypothetical protein [Anabaena sp. AL93]|uniref:hypothetical protein n=1 Tax=Anabaena sp. AL93 TaxID=1678133 RepID=UPI0025BFD388|nr:hypothetical protein [Anabaena sp. AL93]
MNTESEYYLHSNLNRRKWEKPTPTWTKKRFQKTIPTERFAIALPHPQQAIAPHNPKQRFLRSASLSHLHTPKQRTACSSASLSPSHIPKSDSCGALRYRTPTPQKAIAPLHIPKKRYAARTVSLANTLYISFKL